VKVPQGVLDICRSVEVAVNDDELLGIRFDPEMWCWVLNDQRGEIYAKLSANRFGVPPEVAS
jgi:hypothetical protein